MNRNETNGRSFRVRARRAAMLLAAVTLLAGCATTPRDTDPLVQRAQARWDAIIERDYDTAYALYSPGYRSAHSRADFEIDLRSRRITWTSAAYREHSCDGAVCTLTFDVEFLAPRPVPGVNRWNGKSSVDETWIEDGGLWWYVPPKR